MTASAVTTKKSLWETMKDLSSQGIEPRSAKAIEMFRSFIQAWRGRLHQSFTVENLTEFVEKTEYRREIEHLYPDRAISRLDGMRSVK